jgi:hypothetical protein
VCNQAGKNKRRKIMAKQLAKEIVVDRGEDISTASDGMKPLVEARVQSIVEQGRATARQELAEPLYWWEIFAIGPFQWGAQVVPPADLLDQPLLPHRILQVGETASIYTVVFLNPFFPQPALSACDIITAFTARIELNYFTSNTQTMQPVRDLSNSVCIETVRNQCFYVDEYRFTPQEPACLYETNICARLCNCDNLPIQPFGAFVRWVQDLDFDLFFGSPGLQFDQPIRYMVSDLTSGCASCS